MPKTMTRLEVQIREESGEPEWLAFTPACSARGGRRGSTMPRLGAHAFAPGADRSLCRSAPRARAGGGAASDARRCVACERELARLDLAAVGAQLGDRPAPAFDYVWRVHARLPDRYGQPCAVLARGAMNSCLVRFADGYEVITSRNYLRRQRPARTEAT